MSTQAGQALWFDEFRANYRDLLRFLRRRTRCDETARDLAQDAWLRVAGTHGESEATAAPPASADHARAYLFTVAERLAIDHLRRQRLWNDELAPRLLAGPFSTPDVAESHAYAQALRAVDDALREMPQRMRDVFIAHRLEGVPHEELAERFQVSRKTIEREVTRAMDLAQCALSQGTAAAHSTPPARHGRRKALGALLGLAGIGGSFVLASRIWREAVAEWQTAFATPAGRIGKTSLPDGSTMTLDADSAVDVRLYAGRRLVTLSRGGAFFAVARDAASPFVVEAGDVRVTVLGTRFAVEMDARGVAVAVESGRVVVQTTRGVERLELGAGDAARVDSGSEPRRAAPRAANTVAPWRTGWLDFDRLPLGEAVAQLNRYRPAARITVAPAVAALPVLARVNIPRSTQWLQGLPGVLPVKVSVAEDGGATISPR